MSLLDFTGCNHFRQRLILSLLSAKPIRISEVRSLDLSPGLKDFEASMLRMLDKMTNGTQIVVNETGTGVRFVPGQLLGGEFTHSCPSSRSMVYFLEVLAALGPFCKQPLKVTLKGRTHGPDDISVDSFKSVTLPLLARVGIEGTGLKVEKRGVLQGEGHAIFSCGILTKVLPPISWTEEGKIRRVRGVAWTCRVSPQFSAGVIDAARGLLNQCLADVWVYTDAVKLSTQEAREGEEPRGFGISVVSESDRGTFKAADMMSHGEEDPAEMGKKVGLRLLQEIEFGGVVDTSSQWLLLFFMALSADHRTSVCWLGRKLSPSAVEMLRNLELFLGVRFRIDHTTKEEKVVTSKGGVGVEEEEKEEKEVESQYIRLQCVGVAMSNAARRTF